MLVRHITQIGKAYSGYDRGCLFHVTGARIVKSPILQFTFYSLLAEKCARSHKKSVTCFSSDVFRLVLGESNTTSTYLSDVTMFLFLRREHHKPPVKHGTKVFD